MKYKLWDSWLLLPAILFLGVALKTVINVPVMDDYDIILEFLYKYRHEGFLGKLGLIFSQYGEHRCVPSKLIYVGYYYLTGGINFRILCLLGDLQLIPIGCIGIYFIRKYCVKWRLLSILWMVLVFDLNTYENGSMCMYAIANYGVLCYFFCSLYFYDKYRWLLGVLFQILCIFSNANGLYGAVVLAGFGLLQRSPLASLVATTFIPLYFIHYHPVVLPEALPFDLGREVMYCVQMIGAPVSFMYSAFCGFWILIGVILYFPYKKIREYPGIIAIFAMVLGTVVLAAVFRSGYKDAQFQTSRYLIYPQLVIGCLTFFIFLRDKRGWIWSIAGILLVAYYFNYQFGYMGFERTAYRAETRQYWHPHPGQAKAIADRARLEEIYDIDEHR